MGSLCLSVSTSRCADALGAKDGKGTHASQNDEEVESVAGSDHGDDDTWVVFQEEVLVNALSFTELGMLQRLSVLLFYTQRSTDCAITYTICFFELGS